MIYKIEINNPGRHFNNPLLKLDGRLFDTRDAASEELYDALFEVIMSEDGCEMIDRIKFAAEHSDISADRISENYAEYVHDIIISEGYASEDGVSAMVNEVSVNDIGLGDQPTAK